MQTPAADRSSVGYVMQRLRFHAVKKETESSRLEARFSLACRHQLTACSGGGSSGGRGRSARRVGERGGGAKPYVGGARESFGGIGVIMLADDGRLAAQGTGHRRLAGLEGIDHIHLKEGQP